MIVSQKDIFLQVFRGMSDDDLKLLSQTVKNPEALRALVKEN